MKSDHVHEAPGMKSELAPVRLLLPGEFQGISEKRKAPRDISRKRPWECKTMCAELTSALGEVGLNEVLENFRSDCEVYRLCLTVHSNENTWERRTASLPWRAKGMPKQKNTLDARITNSKLFNLDLPLIRHSGEDKYSLVRPVARGQSPS